MPFVEHHLLAPLPVQLLPPQQKNTSRTSPTPKPISNPAQSIANNSLKQLPLESQIRAKDFYEELEPLLPLGSSVGGWVGGVWVWGCVCVGHFLEGQLSGCRGKKNRRIPRFRFSWFGEATALRGIENKLPKPFGARYWSNIPQMQKLFAPPKSFRSESGHLSSMNLRRVCACRKKHLREATNSSTSSGQFSPTWASCIEGTGAVGAQILAAVHLLFTTPPISAGNSILRLLKVTVGFGLFPFKPLQWARELDVHRLQKTSISFPLIGGLDWFGGSGLVSHAPLQ